MMDKVKLKEFVQKGVNVKTIMESAKDDLKLIAEDAKEALDIKPADFNARVVAAYDKQKAKEALEKKQDVLNDIEGMGF